MALSRIARNGYRRSGGGPLANYATDKSLLCEGTPTPKCHSPVTGNLTALGKNVATRGDMTFIPSVGTFAGANFGSRGIWTTPQSQFGQAERVVSESDSEYESFKYPTLEATKPGEKARVVVLGSGWAACRFLKGLDTRLYDVVCISPRNHMVFTPLLASTCVGTLEFRSVAEPVSQIQTALAKDPNSYFFLASCTGVDTDKHEVYCEAVGDGKLSQKPYLFKVAYDKLVIASGAEPLTFGIKGVKEHAFFLREVTHAQEIRKRLLLNLMLSQNPGLSEEEKERLLHCVVIGGGPTGVEFSGELSDFIMRDVRQRYTHVKNYIRVTLIEANEILSSFDVGLRQYATKHLTKYGVRLVRGVVKEVHADKIVLSDGSDVPYGLLVWSTGVGPSEFVKSLNVPKSPGGRIGVDEWLRVPAVEDVFALGDCAGFLEQVGKPVLPALAQVAERQGKYLVGLFNKIGKQDGAKAYSAKDIPLGDPFVYKHLGSMASVGRYKALVDLRQSKDGKGISMAGFLSWLVWRSAYLTRVISWRNRFYVAFNWATTLVFGRDNSRIG
ncbi:tubulin alpha 1 [Orobanche gracilis]